MARRKIEDRNIRSLTKVARGTSYSVTIPIEYIRKLKWRGKQKLEVKLYQDRIVIRDWKP
jgi:bifunctional DNA-binding transcriptional regulator/antitoxin component of YhaV-PrlF toxin-antitoxin module